MAVRRASRPRFVLILLVLTAGTIITLSYRSAANRDISKVKSYAADVFSPVQRGILGAFRPVANFFRGAFEYGSEQRQNAILRQELANEKGQLAAATDQARQLATLTRLDHLPFAPNLPHVAAEVSATTFSNFQDTVELDRGSASGIRVGMTVVSGAGLVGRVVQVARSTSSVLLITDPSSSIGVRYQGVVGVANGQGAGASLNVDYVFPPAKGLRRGDVMVTSGMQGSLFPPGIPVGRVSVLATHAGDLQEEVQLSPVVSFAQLQFVDVLDWSSSSAGPG